MGDVLFEAIARSVLRAAGVRSTLTRAQHRLLGSAPAKDSQLRFFPRLISGLFLFGQLVSSFFGSIFYSVAADSLASVSTTGVRLTLALHSLTSHPLSFSFNHPNQRACA